MTDAVIDFHRRIGAGGAAMSTVAYLAVSPEGRTDRHCLYVHDDILPDLRRLTDAVHETGAAAAAQLGHAGPVANPKSNRAPSLAPSRRHEPARDHEPRHHRTRYRPCDRRLRACRGALVVDAGFDSIEIHMGHNYLLSVFLSPKLNRRQWGGSVENRARFARHVVRAVRDAVDDRARDACDRQAQHGRRCPRRVVARRQHRSGPTARVRRGARRNHAHRWQLTGQPHVPVPGRRPAQEFAATLPLAARLGFRLGRRFMPDYPFEEAFFLPYARQFRAAVHLPLVLLGGINELDTRCSRR